MIRLRRRAGRGPAITRLRLVAAGLLALACAGTPPYELPEQRSAGRPLAEAPNPRSGEITWRPGPVETTPDGMRVEFTLMNGTTRDYLSVMLRLVLRGSGRETATVRYPAGPLAAHSSKVVRAHLGPPGFVVKETRIELVFAQE